MKKKYFIVTILTAFTLLITSLYVQHVESKQTSLTSKNTINVIDALLPDLSVKDLVDNSTVIVKATVTSELPSQWTNVRNGITNDKPNTISTDYTFAVSNIIKGVVLDTNCIKVRVLKGEIGDLKVISNEISDFYIGENVLLFLRRDDSAFSYVDEDYYIITGWALGKYSQTSDENYKNSFNNSILTTNDISNFN